MKILPLLVSVCFLLVPSLSGEEAAPFEWSDRVEVRIHNFQRADRPLLDGIDVHVDGVWGSTARAYVLEDRLEEMKALGFDVTVVPRVSPNMTRAYHSYSTLTSELQAIAAANPTICELHDIGNSVQGRKLWFMKISDNVSVEEDEPEFKYISTMHGDEPVGMEMCMYLINLLVDDYGTDPQITNLVDNVEIWIMPLMNPDGYSNQSRYNAQGYDLNREFPDRVSDPNNSTSGRPAEVRHVMNWAFGKSSVLSANFHTGALVVNYPYDSDPNPWSNYSATPDDALIIEQSLTYSELNSPMYNSWYFNDGIVNGVEWYMIYGGMQDWNYVWMGCNEVTVELSDNKWPSSGQLPGYWNDNRDSMLAYMELCLEGVRGVVTDSVTGAPVDATVRAVGINHDVYTDPDVGDYHRMLLPGTYSMRFTADGYETQTISSVSVGSGAATRLDVQLVPEGASDPVPDIKVNGSDGPVTVSHTDIATITISLAPNGQAGQAKDWWILASRPPNTHYWTFGGWKPSMTRAYNGALITVNDYVIANSQIPVGTWTLTFAVDTLNNFYEGTYKDTCVVTSY